MADEISGGSVNPMVVKKDVAESIVARYHGAPAGSAAREHFERTVQRKELPQTELAEYEVPHGMRIGDVLVRAGLAESKRAAERLISGNGVKIDGIVVNDPRGSWTAESAVLSVGSRKFVRVRAQKE
jgi:tyrosyl-tRNA synthetase